MDKQRTPEEIRREKIDAVAIALGSVPSGPKEAEKCIALAEQLVEHGVEQRKRGTWIRDESYDGKSKDLYRCSCCGHWETVHKSNPNAIRHINYCSFCGARMKVKT